MRLISLWQRVPAIVQAVVVGLLVCELGGLPPYLVMFGNLKLWPAIPIFLPLSALWLWLFWEYLNGRGWPRSISKARHDALRARHLGSNVWRWSLVAGGLGMISVVALAFVTSRLANLPRDAFKSSLNVSAFPWWTQLSILLLISVSAGVVEESAFRGYALSIIERRHGWALAILVTGVMFFVAHLGHAYSRLRFCRSFSR